MPSESISIAERCNRIVRKDRAEAIEYRLAAIIWPSYTCSKCIWGGGNNNEVGCNALHNFKAQEWTEFMHRYNEIRRRISELGLNDFFLVSRNITELEKQIPRMDLHCEEYETEIPLKTDGDAHMDLIV